MGSKTSQLTQSFGLVHGDLLSYHGTRGSVYVVSTQFFWLKQLSFEIAIPLATLDVSVFATQCILVFRSGHQW